MFNFVRASTRSPRQHEATEPRDDHICLSLRTSLITALDTRFRLWHAPASARAGVVCGDSSLFVCCRPASELRHAPANYLQL